MSIPTQQTIDYWLDWFGFLADDRLSPPQADEAKQVLELARVEPELLVVCKDLLAFMEEYDLLDWNLTDDDQARIDAAFVAIAKVERQR